jgi:hypothetical protein
VTGSFPWLPLRYQEAIPKWRTGRRWAVPASMVDRATRRREAGDWRGACAAAGFDVRFGPHEVRDRYGAEVADRLDDDLRHLVPDLIRWHLPREIDGGLARILPDLPIGLAWYGGPALWVHTPTFREGPPRPQLRFGPLDRADPVVQGERWDGARHLWDARATDRFLYQFSPPAREVIGSFLHFSDVDGAWALAGIAATMDPENRGEDWFESYLNEQRYARVISLVAEVRRRLAAGSTAEQFVPGYVPRYHRTVVVRATATGLTATVVRDRSEVHGAQILPRVTWQPIPELELLDLGLLPRSGLHPLVRAALFPDEPQPEESQPEEPQPEELKPDGYRPRGDIVAPPVVRVRCGGRWHRIGWRDGRIEPHDHPADELRRERAMRALGGAVPPCAAVTEAWRTPTDDRLPRALRTLRGDAQTLIRHGDVAGFIGLLDAGVDPTGLRDRRRRTPLHLAAHLTDTDVDPVALVRRLVGAGIDVDAPDADGRTPLGCVLFHGGSAALVRALLDAGADPTRPDRAGLSALDLMRSVDAATILPWLLDAGLPLDGTRRLWTPLVYQVYLQAPVETPRAMLDAGATGDVTLAMKRNHYDFHPISDRMLAEYRTIWPGLERKHG